MSLASAFHRQIAIAGTGSLALHCAVLISVFGASLDAAEIAGGGASFVMGGAGGERPDGADLSDHISAVEAEDEAQDEAKPDEATPRTEDLAKAETPEAEHTAPQPRVEPAKPVTATAAPQASSPPASTSSAATLARANPKPSVSANPSASSATSPTQPSAHPAARPTTRSAAGNGNSSRAASRKGGNAAAAGNSATTNYAGLVFRHASRHRRANTTGPGEVRIRMVLGMDGRLESSSIARSSGSSRFDRQALMMVRRASPFPRPPVGVNRKLVIGIKGK